VIAADDFFHANHPAISNCMPGAHRAGITAAVAKRVGGGFGGKASRCMPVAAAAALAAMHFDRPVCYSLNRNDDLAQNPGRCFGRVLYDVGFEDSGKLIALQAQVSETRTVIHIICPGD
jgi:xanthine dehydrogenase molybdopterin-binding subunit B